MSKQNQLLQQLRALTSPSPFKLEQELFGVDIKARYGQSAEVEDLNVLAKLREDYLGDDGLGSFRLDISSEDIYAKTIRERDGGKEPGELDKVHQSLVNLLALEGMLSRGVSPQSPIFNDIKRLDAAIDAKTKVLKKDMDKASAAMKNMPKLDEREALIASMFGQPSTPANSIEDYTVGTSRVQCIKTLVEFAKNVCKELGVNRPPGFKDFG